MELVCTETKFDLTLHDWCDSSFTMFAVSDTCESSLNVEPGSHAQQMKTSIEYQNPW